MRGCHAVVACALLALPAARPAAAQEMFAGTWAVVDAQPAPWVDGSSAAQPFVNDAVRQGRITFAGERVDGPPPLGCGQARYEVVRAGPEYLFQGGLADPAAQAAALGFGGGEIVHLSLGCVRDGADIGMDFSLIDADTALFALDNVIYRMVREQPQ